MKQLFGPIWTYLRRTDYILWVPCLLLSGLSMLLLLGILQSGYADSLELTRRTLLIQGIAVAIGILGAIALSLTDYHSLTKLWKIHVPATYLLMLATFVVGVGALARPEDRRWLNIPGVTTIQPVELLKLSFILVFAYHIYLVHEKMNQPLHLLGLLLHGLAPVVLIHYQGDDGSALMFAAIILCMLFAAGLHWIYMVIAAGGTAIGIPLLWNFILSDFQKLRILALINQSEADLQNYYYQQYWAKIAIGVGGVGGKGIFGSHVYVPFMYTDFIFSFLAESLGLIGCSLTLLAMMIIWIRILHDGHRAFDIQGRLICVGVFAMLSFQAAINIGMNISVLPVIGNPLPFLSCGGSSMVTSFLGIGLVLSVYRHSTDNMFD